MFEMCGKSSTPDEIICTSSHLKEISGQNPIHTLVHATFLVYDSIIQFKDKVEVQQSVTTISKDNEVKKGVHSTSDNDDKTMIHWYDE